MLVDSTLLPDRYQGVSKLGSGAMGTVYKARDNVLKRFVAIKILRKSVLDASAVRRFQKEAKSAGSLTHDSLVTIYDFGVNKDNLPYLVMELVEGPTLADCISKYGQLSAEFVMEIGIQIAEGMSYAHQNGVIHRDLKASNVVLFSDIAGHEKIKIIDFGIARMLVPDDDDGKLTEVNAILGSPLYLSPEQASGQCGDEVSDIYALGCLLFEALTGQLPFEASSMMEVLKLKMTSDPPKFSDVSDAQIPGALKRIVYRCLKRDPKERYQCMADLKVDLDLCKQITCDETLILAPQEAMPRVTNEGNKLGTTLAIVATVIVGILAIGGSCMYLFGFFDSEASNANSLKEKKAHLIDTPILEFANRNIGEPVVEYIEIGKGQFYCNVQRGKFTDADLLAYRGKPIVRLNIQDKQVTDKSMPLIGELPLETIELGDTEITGAGLQYLAGSKTLKELRLRGNDIKDEDLRALKGVPLRELRLSFCSGFSDKGLSIVKDQWPDIESLHIADTRMSLAGVKMLPQFKKLNELDVNLTEDGLQEIAKMKSLKKLYISRSELNENMLQLLCQMNSLENLKLVTCRGVGRKDFERLEKSLPQCKVVTKY